MYKDVIIAGFGGQGVLLIGNLLALAAMEEGYEVTFMPVYGVEMRGGTANCTVIIADEEIASPIIQYPESLIIMNQPSLEKFQPKLKDNGIQVINSSMVDEKLVEKNRVKSYLVPANDIADKIGNMRCANMVALGAWMRITEIIPLERIINTLEEHMPKKDLIEINKKAIFEGVNYIEKLLS